MTTFKQFLKSHPRKEKLASCGHALDLLDKEKNYKIRGQQVCADCYFSVTGKEIDESLIGLPMLPGGCY